MNTLEYIAPERLRAAWPIIKPGLETIKQRGGTWIPEDVYHALRAGASSLYVARIDGQYAGFLVLTLQQDYDGQQLFVWCCYAETEADPVALFVEDLRQIAQHAGAKRIVFGSPRRWDRRLQPFGFKPLTTYYGMEL